MRLEELKALEDALYGSPDAVTLREAICLIESLGQRAGWRVTMPSGATLITDIEPTVWRDVGYKVEELWTKSNCK